MIGLEQASYTKGEESGIKKGEEKERKKSRENMIDLLTTMHLSKEEINNHLIEYDYEPLPE